ncbi:hypothetical protein GE061_010362 [Apolygus lucorum]|uniref:Uncharacterized protein n=1 Tax=Apolygus lucorum TaxID=248454 RepID=A0A6A4KGR1_APOLU|nr:hypothetical protein GE061_010362 [Apolygus lucorum]
MVSEHVNKIRYLHSFGEGSRFGMIYITNDDEAYGVGYNGDFNLLGPSGENFLKKTLDKPVKIPGLSGQGIEKISVGDHKGVALDAHGQLYQWGLPYGKIRSSYDRSSIQIPHVVTFISHVVSKLDCGGGFFGVITDSKKVFMYGYIDWSAPYSDGRLFSPMHKEVSSISCGAWHMSMLTTDGKIYTFGHGAYGQLGYEWTEDYGYWRVEKIHFDEPCVETQTGSVSTMFITESGAIWACGLNHPQFGRLGVNSEEPTITKPVRVKIDEPVCNVNGSYTLCNLHTVYAAKSKISSKIYVWGWSFDSKWPQPYEKATSLYDVFHYIATPSNLGDQFLFSSDEAIHESESRPQPLISESSDHRQRQSSTSSEQVRKKLELVLPNRRINNTSAKNTLHATDKYVQKVNVHRLNSLKNPQYVLHKNAHNAEKNKLLQSNPPYLTTIYEKPPVVVCKDTAYKSYLDYVYSGGSKSLEFDDLIEVYLLAVYYEEKQLIEHTYDQIKSRLNESNFPVLLEQSQTHHSEDLKKLSQVFIKTLCNDPQKVAELIISLNVKK